MEQNRSRLAPLSLVALVSLTVACSDDDGNAPPAGQKPTKAEAELTLTDISQSIATVLADTVGQLKAAYPGGPPKADVLDSYASQCKQSGKATLNITSYFGTDYDFGGELVFAKCKGGCADLCQDKTLKLDGKLTGTVRFSGDDMVVEVSGSLTATAGGTIFSYGLSNYTLTIRKSALCYRADALLQEGSELITKAGCDFPAACGSCTDNLDCMANSACGDKKQCEDGACVEPTACPSSCTADADCASCGAKTACVSNVCSEPPTCAQWDEACTAASPAPKADAPECCTGLVCDPATNKCVGGE